MFPNVFFHIEKTGRFGNALLFLFPVLTASVLGYLLFDYLRTKEPTFSHKLAIKKYFQFRFLHTLGFFVSRELEKDSRDIKAHQEKTLLDILSLNGASEYSRKWKLDKVKSREEFRRIHPLTKFSQFESFINRTADGEKNIIVCQDPIYYGTTSGTTGNPSLIPIVPAQTKQMMRYVALVVYKLSKTIPGLKRLKRVNSIG